MRLSRLTAISTLLLLARSSAAQESTPLPFGPGEKLTYSVAVRGFGTVGRGVMTVEGPVVLREASALLLRFELSAGVLLLRGSDRSASWLDPQRFASLRYEKEERHPFADYDEAVELYPEARRWERANGEGGVSPTDAPLDELSFMYYLRTLPLTPGARYEVRRHFEAGRNPIVVNVIRRESIETGVGTMAAVLVEMRVRDPRRYKGEGVITLHISDDQRRIPLRIETRMPVFGATRLTLDSYSVQTAATR